jgi:membrane associated rhomboid family serine protease
MIIPIGHDDSAVRRLPWVTWSIIALCLLALLGTDFEAAYESPAKDVYFEQAADYFREHAYLVGHDEILEHVRYDVPPNQRSQYVPALRELTGLHAPETPEGIAAEQRELDRLTDLALGLTKPEGETNANPFQRWGLVPEAMSLTTIVTHVFMHAGWLHWLGNMLLLFVMGPALEDRWGRPLYASFYLAAGAFAGVFYATLAHDPSMPLVGASGAISGVMGAFLIRHWHVEMRFAYFLFAGLRLYRGIFSAPAWAMLPLWFGKELLSAWFADASGLQSGVAYWAHVGGFVFGAGIAAAIRVAKIEERFIHDKIESQITVTEGNETIDAALAARDQGDLETAFTMLAEEVERSPEDVDAVLAFWDVAGCVQRAAAAAPAIAGLIKRQASQGELEAAQLQWLELVNLVPTQLVDPGTLLRLLPLLREQGDEERVLLALRQAVDPSNPGLSAGMAMRVIDEVGDTDPPTTLRAAHVALGNPDLHEAKREKLQAMVAELEAAGVEQTREIAAEEAERQRPIWDEDGAIEFDAEDLDAELGEGFFADRNATSDEATLRERDAQAPEVPPVPLAAPPAAAPRAADGSRAAVEPPQLPASPPPLPTAPPPLPPPDESQALAALVDAPRFPDLKLVEGVPTRIAEGALYLRTPNTRKAKIEYTKVEAIAVAAVEGIGSKPVLLIDLLLNWNDCSEGPLRAVRLRSDAFDARQLVPDAERTSDALRALARTLLERCAAVPLPDSEAVGGKPFAVYASLPTYEREVLQVDR